MGGVTPFRGLLVSALCAGLAACAGTPKPDLKPTSYLDAERAKISAAPQALLGDACVVRDVSGSGDHILRQQTQDIAAAALTSVKQQFERVDVELAIAEILTACAGLERVGIPPRVAPTWETKDTVHEQAVFALDEGLSETDAALSRRLVAAVDGVIANAEGGYKRRPLGLGEDDRASLRERAGRDTVWVLSILGIDVSAAKFFLAGGQQNSRDCSRLRDLASRRTCELDAEQAARNSDRFSYKLALVDLETGELVWFNNTPNVPGRPYEPSNFGAEWAKRALSPFYK